LSTAAGERDSIKKGLLKAVSVMTLFTVVSRFLGLAREMVRAHYLGTGVASDAFTIAFMLPNLFRRLVGEGAMVVATVPILVDLKKDGLEAVSRAASALFTLLTFIITPFCILFILFSGFLVEHVFARGFSDNPEKLALTVELTRWMFFYLVFISLAAMAQAVLNAFRVFGPSSFTPILLNISVIACAMLFGSMFDNAAFALALGVMIGGVLQLLWQLPYIFRLGVKLKPSFDWAMPEVRRVLKLMAPGAIGAGVYQVNILFSEMIATYLEDGGVASLQFSARLMEFALGVFVVAISTAVLPTLSQQFRDGDRDGLRYTLGFAVRLVAFITIPATAGLLLIRYPLINVLFRSGEFDAHSVEMTAQAFVFHIGGLFFIGLGRVLLPGFYSMKNMVTPVKVAAFAMIVNVACCLAFFHPLAQGGIALANTVSALAQAAVLLWILARRVGGIDVRSLVSPLARMLAATIVMYAAGVLCAELLGLYEVQSRLLLLPLLCVEIVACGVAFFGSAALMRSPEVRELWRALRRRASKSA